MPTAMISLNVSIGGVSVARTWTRDGEHPNPYDVLLPPAQAGELTTRTGDTEGVVTMSSESHGLETGDLVDLYWTGGMRYGMTATVDGTAVTLAGGAGTVLPADETLVVACLQVEIPTQIDGDSAEVLVVALEYADGNVVQKGHVKFDSAVPAQIAEKDLEADIPLFLDLAGDVANPLTGAPIVVCYASHDSTTDEATLKICTLENF